MVLSYGTFLLNYSILGMWCSAKLIEGIEQVFHDNNFFGVNFFFKFKAKQFLDNISKLFKIIQNNLKIR